MSEQNKTPRFFWGEHAVETHFCSPKIPEKCLLCGEPTIEDYETIEKKTRDLVSTEENLIDFNVEGSESYTRTTSTYTYKPDERNVVAEFRICRSCADKIKKKERIHSTIKAVTVSGTVLFFLAVAIITCKGMLTGIIGLIILGVSVLIGLILIPDLVNGAICHWLGVLSVNPPFVRVVRGKGGYRFKREDGEQVYADALQFVFRSEKFAKSFAIRNGSSVKEKNRYPITDEKPSDI